MKVIRLYLLNDLTQARLHYGSVDIMCSISQDLSVILLSGRRTSTVNPSGTIEIRRSHISLRISKGRFEVIGHG